MRAPSTFRLPRLLASAGVLSLLAAGSAAAQQPLRLGEPVRGTLSASDPTLDDDSHYDLYTLSGPAGTRVRITLRSEEFDAYLAVGRDAVRCDDDCETDDDGGGNTDSRVVVTLDGRPLQVRANSLSAGETGAYTLLAEPAGPAPDLRPKGEVRIGQTVRGTLDEGDPMADDGSYYELWTVRGRAGQRVTLTLRSNDFDAYLAFGRTADGEWEEYDSDDDSGGGESGTDAELQITLEDDGVYQIRANSLDAGETGAYTLTVTEGGHGMGSRGEEWDVDLVEPVYPRLSATLRAGQTVEGTLGEGDGILEDGSYYDLYAFRGQAGQRIRITLRSDDFDAYLSLGTGSAEDFELVDSNDDGDEGTHAVLELTLPSTATYLLRANSLGAEETGRYLLIVQAL